MFAQQGEFVGVFPWEQEQLEWAKKFRIVELGSFEDIEEIDASIYQVPLAYEWLVGFYEQSSSPFDRWAKKKGLLLTKKSPQIESEDDYYYDLCNPTLLHERVEYIVKECTRLGIKGVFFDWGNENFLYEPAFAKVKYIFKKLHPNQSYQNCIATFFDKLRQNGLIVVANQAYRNPPLLDHIDYDLSESLISTDIDHSLGGTIDGNYVDKLPITDFYPVDGTIEGTFENLAYIHNLIRHHKVKKIFHINYAAPKLHPTRTGYKSAPPKEIIYYNFAFAKLFNAWAYTEVPYNREFEEDPIYFVDLGQPVEPIRHFKGGYMRTFQKGFVVVSDRDLTLKLSRRVYDTFTKRWIEPGNYKIEQSYDTITKSYIPIGRIFLYDQTLH